MTSRITLLLVIALSITAAHGMECSFKPSSNILEKFVKSCPRIFDSSDKEYCCLNVSDESFYCCNAQEWALETGLGIIVPAIIGVLVVVTLFVLCISCLCCTCCPWYRRRHRGTVYGTVHTIGGVQQVPGINPPSSHIVNNIHPSYPVNQPVSTATFPSQPPPYTAEPYAKQAPYNPNYQQ
ncbi:hypothetical protein PV326_005375 [Microctonus aethiopoides]|uniref:Protein shisa-5-like n=1 Tax=Microctonus aethiopoides TaxID=144406 RepID=A0AA39FNT3_9HYME|nr:hypothetical protein PV326_005375 [Microctonus aethiopoides]KAK0173047.1 hypothetical protein PV328_006301 [Microctonus aethiopoides]